jgi:hypothetical protein
MRVRLNHRGISDANQRFRFQEGLEEAKTRSGVVELTPQEMDKHIAVVEAKMNMAEEKMKHKIRPEFLKGGGNEQKEKS